MRFVKTHRSGLTLAFAAAIALAPAASGGRAIEASPQAQRPTFQGRSDVVLVDVIVTDRQNRPIRGLTAEDFVVKEDGEMRPIVNLEAVEGGRRTAATSARDSARAKQQEPVSVALFVDDQHLSPGQTRATQSALQSTITSLSVREATVMLVAPASKVSEAAALPFGAGRMVAAAYQVRGKRREDRSSCPLADHEAIQIMDGDWRALARVVSRFSALNPDLNEGGATMFARTRAAETADAARRANSGAYGVALLCLDWLEKHPGRRHLIIVSSGMARDATDHRYKALIERSLQLNVPVHFVDARTLMGGGQYQSMAYGANLSRNADEGTSARIDASAGLDELAADTGGLTVGGTNDLDDAIKRLLETMSSYYVLAYVPAPQGKAGFRKIEVTTSRPGLVIRARRGYEAR